MTLLPYWGSVLLAAWRIFLSCAQRNAGAWRCLQAVSNRGP